MRSHLLRASALRFAMGLALLTIAATPTEAQTYTWTGAATGNWSVASNWLGSIAPVSASTSNLVLSNSTSTAITATQDIISPFNLNSITFAQTAGSGAITSGIAANTLLFQNNGVINPSIVFNNLNAATVSSSFSVNGVPLTISGTGLGSLALTGVISANGTTPLTINTSNVLVSTGVVSISGANTFVGNTTLTAGNLSLGNAAALGVSTNTLIINGGTVSATTTTAIPYAITANVDMRFVGRGTSPTFSGPISGAGGLIVSSQSSAPTVTLTGASTYSGATTVDIANYQTSNGPVAPGTLVVNAGGSIAGSTSINLRSGGILTLAATTVVANRILDTAPVNMNGGIVNITAGTSLANSETVGSLNGLGSHNVITLTSTATATAALLTPTSPLTRGTDRPTFLFRANNANFGISAPGAVNNSNLIFSTAPTTIGGGGIFGGVDHNVSIIPYAIGGITSTSLGSTLVGYDAVNGVRPLTAADYETAMLLTGADDKNYSVTAASTLAGPVTINALVTSVAINGDDTTPLTLTSGVLLNTAAITISAPLLFGAVEGYVANASTLTLSGSIAATNGFTKSGISTLTLSGAANNIDGALTINGGSISIPSVAALGTPDLIVAGGGSTSVTAFTRPGLVYTGAAADTITTPIKVVSGFLNVNPTVTGVQLTLSGQITGSGGIYITGANTEITNATNSYTGQTRVFSGNLVFGSDAVLGNGGAVDIGSGATTGVILTGNWTTNRAVNVSFGSRFDTGAFDATFNGPFTGTSTINKSGSGTWTINTASPYAQAITLNASGGTLRLASSGVLLTASYTLGSATKLLIDNSTGLVSDRVNNSAAIAIAGATVQLTGSSTASVTEILGAITATTTGNIIQVDASGGFESILRINNLVATGTVLIRGTNLGSEATGSVGRVFLNQFNGATVPTGVALTNLTYENTNNPGVLLTALYDPLYGIVPLLVATGSIIDNINAPVTSPSLGFVTNAPTTANLGATIKSLTANNDVTLVPGYTPQTANQFAPTNALVITGGSITVDTGSSIFTSAIPAIVQFGASGTSSAVMTLTQNLEFGSNVTLTTTGGLTKTGAGTLTINGTNSMTGAYSLAGGTVLLPPTGTTAASLAGTGSLDLRGGSLTLNGSATTNFSGAIAGAIPSTLTTTAGFTGVQTLSGANTFIATISINGGTLVAGNATGLGDAANTVTVATGATLGFSGSSTITNNYPITVSGTGAAGRAGAIDNISGTNSFAGPINLAANTTIGATTGTLTLSGGFTGTGIPTFTGAGNVTLSGVALNIGTNTLFKTGTGILTLPDFANTIGNINVTGGGTVAYVNENNFGTGVVTVDNGGISYSGAVPATIPTNLVVNSGGVIFGVTTTGVILSFTGPYTPNGPTTKIGAGTLQLPATTPLTTTQPLVINAGIFDVNANNVTVGALSGTGGTLAIAGTTFTVNQSTNTTYAGIITDSTGTLTKSGSGTLVITTTTGNTVGTLNVLGGTLQFNTGGGAPPADINVAAGATFALNGASTSNSANPFKTVTLNGGTWANNGTSYWDPYLNKLVLNGGTVSVTAAGIGSYYHFTGITPGIQSLASSTTSTFISNNTSDLIQNDATATTLNIDVAQGTTPTGIDLNVAIKFTGGTTTNLTKVGAGTLQLSGNASASTYTMNINEGRLLVATGTGSGTVTINTGATLAGTGTIAGVTTVNTGAKIAPGGLTTIGTLTTAATTINGGTDTSWNIKLNGVAANTPATAEFSAANVSKLSLTGANNLNLVYSSGPITFNIAQIGGAFDAGPVSYVIATTTTTGSIQENGVAVLPGTPLAGVIGTDYLFTGLTATNYDLRVETVNSTTSLVLSFSATPIPEPASILAVSGLALGGLGWIRRRRAMKANA